MSCGEAYRSNAEQPPATVPAGSIGLGVLAGAEPVDALYVYDAYPTSNDVGFVQAPPSGAAGPKGRAIGAVDRGQRSVVAYDARGNATWTARQMAYIPDAPALVAGPARPSGDNRPSWVEGTTLDGPVQYDTQVYARTARFDHAGRGIALTLPRDLTWGDPTGAPPAVGGVLHFNNRGLPARASATIDCDPVTSATACAETPIVSSISYTRDGLPREVEWGDAHGAHAATVSTTTYDVRRRPVRMRTLREATDTAPQSLGSVTEVVHQELVWDVASNLTATIDHRPGDEWAPGHLPQSTLVTHDALYRVIGASFSYSHDDGHRSDEDDPGDTALDTIDWRATQATIRGAGADPMESTPAPMVPTEPDARVRDIAWSWDWLGNTTSWNDDASSFYERSIGTIENGIDVGPSLRPSALYFSTNIPASGAASLPAGQAGWLELEYGRGGNVTTMTVHGQCTNAPAATCDAPTASSPTARAADMRASCACATEQHYEYRWDELNRLSEARRWDRASGGSWGIKVRQRYRYDPSNVRTVKQTFEPTAEAQAGTAGALGERIALYVYPGDFEVRGLQRDGSEYEDLGGHVEAQYVVAGARLVWQFDEGTAGFLPGTRARHQRFTVPLTDIIQTTAATLDVLSGELVEAGTYYPNGARESLVADSSDPSALEPAGFTGKEGDEEVGLTYFGERYLISRTGRWASPDPLEVHVAGAGGEALNAYHYISGNLLQSRDPLGLQSTEGSELRNRIEAQTGDSNPEVYDFEDDFVHVERGGPRTVGSAEQEAERNLALESVAREMGLQQTEDRGYADEGSVRLDPLYEQAQERALSENMQMPLGAVGYAVARGLGNDIEHQRGAAAAGASINGLAMVAVRPIPRAPQPVSPPQAPRQRIRVRAPRASGCAGCPCFLPGTQVMMADGTERAIETLAIDDWVLADDPGDEAPASAFQVEFVQTSLTYRVITIVMRGRDGRIGSLQATGEHPFWTLSDGWVAARALMPGDELLNHAGDAVAVVSVTEESRESPTFNLTIDGVHTCFVTDDGVSALVHNQLYFPDTDLHHGADGPTQFRITAQGSRGRDFTQANRAAGFSRTPRGYTWHHVDDFNQATGEMTMQLVRRSAHRARSHSGGVSQAQRFMRVPYGTQDAVRFSQAQGWLRGRPPRAVPLVVPTVCP